MKDANIKALFNQYSDGSKITDEGIEKFFNDVGLSLEDLETIAICYKMGAENMGKITLDQFKKGCTELGADTTQKWQQAVQKFKTTWKTDGSFYKKVYVFAFEVNREPGMNNLDTETALVLWPMFMTGRCLFLDKWLDFI